MSSCPERCISLARSKPARIVYGVALTIIVCVGVFHLLNASDDLNQQRIAENAKMRILPDTSGGSLIFFRGTSNDTEMWMTKYKEMIYAFKTPHPNSVKCDSNRSPPDGKFCEIDPNDFGPCAPDKNFGLSKQSACVFLNIRPSSGWKPEAYNPEKLPETMPNDLKNLIKQRNNKNIVAWISCEAENPVAQENIGIIEYPVRMEFTEVQISSERALSAVYFKNPQHGIVIQVQCNLWSRDIEETAHFALLLD